MTTKINRGPIIPTVDNLENYQFGWSTTEKKLYIRDDTATQDDPNHKIFEVSPSEAQILTFQNEVDALETDLTTESSERTNADTILQENINTETTTRENADEALNEKINNEITDRTNAISGLQSDIDTLETDLTTEINNREIAISGLQSDINTLETDLTTEINDRQAVISGVLYEIDNLETGLATETNNREIVISGLQSEIDNLGIDLDNEVNNRISEISGAIYISSVDATNKANTAESNAKLYADDLALATQKWLPAVNIFADLPVNPGTGTYLCRVITGSDYGVYQWIGTETNPSWTFFSDNLDFIDRISNPITNNLPIITADGELIDGGESISGIYNTIMNNINDYIFDEGTWDTE
jgi:hypothetical protein